MAAAGSRELLGSSARTKAEWLHPEGFRKREPTMSGREASTAWRAQTVLSAEEAFKLLGIDRSTGYRAIREGAFPVAVVRIGRVIRVPTAALARLLDPIEHPPDAEEAATNAR